MQCTTAPLQCAGLPPIEVHVSHITHLGSPALLLHLRDISERKRADEQLYELAHHDPLTRLPNRKLFHLLLGQALERERKPGYAPPAVIFLDLDQFKFINDSLGHAIGDQVLIAVGHLLRDSVRPEDTVARIGSDEFAILLEYVRDVQDAALVAERLHQEMAIPMYIKGHEVKVTASIGIALSSFIGEQPEDLLRDAGTAAYYAKDTGTRQVSIFDAAMHERVRERQYIRASLPQAIERGELRVHYQPIVELATERIVGFEALLRWQHPERGLLLPDAFVPIAEETDLIIPLGQWLRNEVSRQVCMWTERLTLIEPLKLYVNLSAREFRDPELIQRLQETLRYSSGDRFILKLEITESIMMDNADTTVELLHQLRSLGIELCIDDFGTGYSSLRYLQRFPVQTVKIDHSFIANMGKDKESILIVKAILLMAHALHMDVVAERIERLDQIEQLRSMGCDYGQGYFFARPVDGTTAGQLLNNARL